MISWLAWVFGGGPERLETALQNIDRKLDTIMLTLTDVQAAVSAETTVETGVVTLLQTLSTDLKAAMASNDQTALKAIVDQLDGNAARMAAAVVDNTSAAATTGTATIAGGGSGATSLSGDQAASTVTGAAS